MWTLQTLRFAFTTGHILCWLYPSFVESGLFMQMTAKLDNTYLMLMRSDEDYPHFYTESCIMSTSDNLHCKEIISSTHNTWREIWKVIPATLPYLEGWLKLYKTASWSECLQDIRIKKLISAYRLPKKDIFHYDLYTCTSL